MLKTSPLPSNMTGFTKSGFDHGNARTKEQQELMKKIEADGVCSFCYAHFKKYHPEPVIKENDSWLLTTNMSPYEGTKYHFFFVYKPDHKINISDMSREESADLFELVSWVTTEHNIEAGSFFMRFGIGGYNGSSVEHLHAHLIVGEKQSEDTEALRVKLGYKNKS